jgi:hypothetical protein
MERKQTTESKLMLARNGTRQGYFQYLQYFNAVLKSVSLLVY